MIVIAGYGYVGQAFYETFKDLEHCEIVDPKHTKNKITDFDATHVVVAVSTPEGEDGACDMTNVRDVVGQCTTEQQIMIKSTISIEGWQQLRKDFPDHRLTFSPEFLRAKSATKDFQDTKHIYLAGQWSHSWIPLLKKRFPTAIYSIRKTPEELIAGKYFRNAYLATKVTFFNQVHDMCEKMGMKFEQVREIITDDPRIGRDHSEVTEERGFGGHCLPKDCEAITKTAGLADVELRLIKSAIEYNKKIRQR
jgi:UDPglucose 6-dehydrogenase